MADPLYFQWQNPILVESIYPMRREKLRDFLVYYQEIDCWREYQNKDLSTDIPLYQTAQRNAAIAAYKTYAALRNYFMQKDVRAYYSSSKFRPIDEAELLEINELHELFVNYFPGDIRGERSFVTTQMTNWSNHRKLIVDKINSRKRRLAGMDPGHEKYSPETKELERWENITLKMADQELAQLEAFLGTYDRIEKRKLEWYQLKKKDPNYSVLEAEYLVRPPTAQPSVRDIVSWKVAEYETSLKNKNQFQLLEEIYRRFSSEPQRYPLWLQYMVVHFSGMRYASAHGSWADPRDLLARLRAPDIQSQVRAMSDADVEKMCREKIAAYASTNGMSKPGLAQTRDPGWKARVSNALANVKSSSPKDRRNGLGTLLVHEMEYDLRSVPTVQVLEAVKAMKGNLPAWAWKEVVRLTPLRVTEVTDPNWETFSSQEQAEQNLPQYANLRMLINEWREKNFTVWREEHGRSHELIVSRAVCNETAEHIQHLRGHLPPGGLSPKLKWYRKIENEHKLPGTPPPYYAYPRREEDYTQGASIFWLRFVDKKPDDWQIAESIETKDKIGLIPREFFDSKAAAKNEKQPGGRKNRFAPKPKKDDGWKYQLGETITRTRTAYDANKKLVPQMQWLRWIHEATVVEIADTAEGRVMLTFETSLPDDYKGISSIGIFKKPMAWLLSDGTEDAYNRSFVGYVPEGQVPVEDLREMLDWNKILRRTVV